MNRDEARHTAAIVAGEHQWIIRPQNRELHKVLRQCADIVHTSTHDVQQELVLLEMAEWQQVPIEVVKICQTMIPLASTLLAN